MQSEENSKKQSVEYNTWDDYLNEEDTPFLKKHFEWMKIWKSFSNIVKSDDLFSRYGENLFVFSFFLCLDEQFKLNYLLFILNLSLGWVSNIILNFVD